MGNRTPTEKPISAIDVRTNILLLIIINTLVLTEKGGIFQIACTAIVGSLLLSLHRFQAAFFLTCLVSILMTLPFLANRLGLPFMGKILVSALLYVRPYLIAGFMGYYFICATPPNLLITGMNRLKVPQVVTIPLAVMLRFLPVIWEEQKAIRNAMRMRGLPGRGGVLLHPFRTLEYILIPLIGVTLRSGEALSRSALSRGLGSPIQPSSILSLKFGFIDLLMVLLCIALLTLFFYS